MPARRPPGTAKAPARSQLDEIADELYSALLADFTALRNARADEAKRSGAVALARDLRALRKPTVSAWLTNLLVRERPREVESLLDLGAQLRDAQSALDAGRLRCLSEQRRELVSRLGRDARSLATDKGQQVGEAALFELETTLEAGLFDPGAAEEIRAGKLTSALAYSGMGFSNQLAAEPSGETQTPRRGADRATRSASTGSSRSSPPPSTRTTRREAQRKAREARKRAEHAAAALATAVRASEHESAALAAAEEELARRRRAARAAERVVRDARAALDAAERDARQAEVGLGTLA